MNTNYSKLFTVELLHDYFADSKCKGLQILPTRDCASVCKQMNIQLRNNQNELMAFIRENDEQGPFINSGTNQFYHKYYNNIVFRFYITMNSSTLLHYTNIEYAFNDNKKFYFSNLAGNEQNGEFYLTAPVADYTPGNTYNPGALVKDTLSGNVYESLKKTVAAKKKNPLSDTTLWAPKGLLYLQKPVDDFAEKKDYQQGSLVKKPGSQNVYEATKRQTSGKITDLEDTTLWLARGEGQLQYATDNDSIIYCGSKYIVNLPAAITSADIDVYGFNFDAVKPGYAVALLPHEKRNFKTPSTQVSINFETLAPGMYKIKVNDQVAMVYYDPVLNAGNILGVVEIFNHLPASNNYALLDNNEKIRNITYQVRFANRRVLWKYVRKDGRAKTITDTGDTKYEFNLDGEAFISAVPIPLTEFAVKTLKLDFNTKDFALKPLPNPGTERLAICTQDGFDYFCSEVYLNY